MARPRCPKRPEDQQALELHPDKKVNAYSKQSVQVLTGSTDAMKVRLSQLGKIKVDHNIHSLNVDSSCEEVCMGQIEGTRQRRFGTEVNKFGKRSLFKLTPLEEGVFKQSGEDALGWLVTDKSQGEM